MHVAGTILCFCAISFDADGAIVSAETYTCFPGFIINSRWLLASLFEIIAKRSIAILKYWYRLIDTIPKVQFVAGWLRGQRHCS